MTEPFRNERVLSKLPGWPGLDLWTRPVLLDETVIEEVILHDGYGLSDLFGGMVPSAIRGSVVIDLGAHVGVFSAYCAHQGARRVIAVEPEPENLELLRLNTEAWPAVEILECAMGATEGSTWIVGESGGAHAIEGAQEGSEVRRITLAGLLDTLELEHVDLLKLDMEGGEIDTLLGCDHDHLARVDYIVLETHGPLSCPWVQPPRVGEIVEHLLHTHNVDASGSPLRLGKIAASRNGARSGW